MFIFECKYSMLNFKEDIHYISDKPCKQGHKMRYKKNNLCAICARFGAKSRSAKRKYDAEYNRSRIISQEPLARMRLHGAKARARKFNLPFDLDFEWMMERMDKCAVTNIPFELERTGEKQRSFAPSIDRIDPQKGYTKDNCRMVIGMYNRAKGEGTDEDVMRMVNELCR